MRNGLTKWLTRRRLRGCNSALFGSRRNQHETDLSAIEVAPQAHAWLSRAQTDPRRAGRGEGPPRQRAGSIDGLSQGAATLPRSARLLRREDYSETLAAGETRSRRHFTLYVRRNGLEQARIGIIASKRIAPRAVDRNRAKRLAREVFRALRRQLGGVDIVVQLRRCPARGAQATARAELARLVQELGAAPRGD